VTSTKPIPETAAPPFDPERLQAFMGRVMGDMSGALLGFMGAIGDRLGLFGLLAAGPLSAGELARRAGVDPRYVRDWLNALTTAGYLENDPVTGLYTLPPEHAMVLAAEGTPMFLGGAYQQIAGFAGVLDLVTEAMRERRGVPPSEYSDDMFAGMERMSATWIDHMLVQQWIPAIPGLEERLRAGARVADVGCGSGRALVALGRAFPDCELTGFDRFAPALERAAQNASAGGIDDRLRLVQRDAADGLYGPFDLITTFDMLHDARRPQAIAQCVRRALDPDGVWLLVEMNAGENVGQNAGPVGTILYGTSVMFCTPTSIASGADGIGTLGLPESEVRRLCTDAGFRTVNRVPVMNPFNALYEVRS
jgi:2-polyprenyl-3-methyl-5-hydroxy-6-metoxy-1,4-benzoquinol methylase